MKISISVKKKFNIINKMSINLIISPKNIEVNKKIRTDRINFF